MEKTVFGTIFVHGEDVFVFLGYDHPKDILHVAKILDIEKSHSLESRFAIHSKRRDYNPKDLIWCYTTLSSQDFEGRAAHFGNSGDWGVKITATVGELNDNDRKALRKDILESYVSNDLKDIIRKTTPDE